MPVAPLISLQGLGFTYASGKLDVQALKDVTLDVHAGEFVAIIGQSGSGKTTLMNVIGCLSRPTSGDYVFNGRSVLHLDADGLAEIRRNSMGFVFQNYNLLESADAAENVQVPAIYAGVSRSERQQRALKLLSDLALADRRRHLPSELSGGEQQRVALARALMNGGQVILADEPTGALDSKTSAEIIERLEALAAAGHTVIMVTHNRDLAARAERRVELLDGKVVADSRPVEARARAAAPTLIATQKPSLSPVSLSPSALWQACTTGFRAMNANRFRTSLTLLGIVIGVLSVIIMLSIAEGARHEIMQHLGDLGASAIEVRPDHAFSEASAGPVVRMPKLKYQDGVAIKAQISNIEGLIPWRTSVLPVLRSGFHQNAHLVGTSPDALRIKRLRLNQGTFFTQAHFDSLAPVAVIGDDVRAEIFADGVSPVGAHVLIQNAPFQVIGTLAPKHLGGFGYNRDDRSIFVPLSTARARLFGDDSIDSLQVKASEVEQVSTVMHQITTLLEARRGKRDFVVQDAGALLQTRLEVVSTITLVFGGIGAISLLVAGIGVMNIMLVSVTQRTREIGIRMAAGARNGDVLLQFLFEAVAVCVAGGLLALLLALLVADILPDFEIPLRVTSKPIIWSLSVAMATGIIFGFAPAWRAARLDPAKALASA